MNNIATEEISSESSAADSKFNFLKESFGAILKTKYENLCVHYEEVIQEWEVLHMYYYTEISPYYDLNTDTTGFQTTKKKPIPILMKQVEAFVKNQNVIR